MTTDNLDKIATHPLQTSAWAEFRSKWGNEVVEGDDLLSTGRMPAEFTDSEGVRHVGRDVITANAYLELC